MRSKETVVSLHDLRPGEFAGRNKQNTDPALVSSYLEFKRTGAEFPPLKVTKDNVIIAGNHRHEMYMMFFKDENPPIPVIMYDVAWDEATADEQQALKDLAFADNWNPKSGRPLDFPGVVRNVRQHVYLERSDAQVMSTLGPVYGAKVVRRALNSIKQAIQQEKFNTARRLYTSGMPLPKALADAKLPKDTDPKLITEGREQRGGRPHQVTKAAESCSKKWKYNLDNATDLYLAKSSSQNQLLSIVDAMDRGAELLRRQAARSRRLALEVIAENAKRLRS